jgi:ABC-2 type transport system permease protein
VVWLLFAVPLIVIFAGAAFGADGIKPVWHEFQDLVPGLAYAAICAVVHAAVALLAASFSKRRAFAAAGVVAAFLVTLPVVGAIRGIYSGDGRHLAMALNPLSLTNAVGTWLFEPGRDQIGGYGWVFGVAAVALTGWCIALLLARYRRVAS